VSVCRRAVFLTAGAALCAVSRAAYADPVGPNPLLAVYHYVFGIPAFFGLEFIITVAEAFVYWRAASLEWREAVVLSAVANVSSALFGLFLRTFSPWAVVLKSSNVSLIIGMSVALAVEVPIVMGLASRSGERVVLSQTSRNGSLTPACRRRKERLPMRRLLAAAVLVNVVTYMAAEEGLKLSKWF
jgi:hypothetical protein